MRPAPVRQPDDLEAIPGLAVGRLTGHLFEGLGVGLGESDSDHGRTRAGGSAVCSCPARAPRGIRRTSQTVGAIDSWARGRPRCGHPYGYSAELAPWDTGQAPLVSHGSATRTSPSFRGEKRNPAPRPSSWTRGPRVVDFSRPINRPLLLRHGRAVGSLPDEPAISLVAVVTPIKTLVINAIRPKPDWSELRLPDATPVYRRRSLPPPPIRPLPVVPFPSFVHGLVGLSEPSPHRSPA